MTSPYIKFKSSDIKLDFKDVLIVPRNSRISSRSMVSLERSITFKTTPTTKPWTGVPIVSSNMDTVTNLETFDKLSRQKYVSCFPKHLNEEWLKDQPPQLANTDYYMLSCGTNDDDVEILANLVDTLERKGIKVRFLCVDVANGYMERLVDVCAHLRERFPKVVLTAGNVVTPERVQELITKGGANIVKVGIGSGSVCDTRIKTGIGYPQFSAVLECAQAAKRYGGHIMSDGGIIYPGDIVKAYGAGASFVMLGSMLAGATESPGELILNPRDNKWYKAFYGMSSRAALEKYNGGFKNYRTSEGKERHIPHKGTIKNIINDINGGLRSACTYLDCYSIEDIEHNAEFVQVSQHHNTLYH